PRGGAPAAAAPARAAAIATATPSSGRTFVRRIDRGAIIAAPRPGSPLRLEQAQRERALSRQGRVDGRDTGRRLRVREPERHGRGARDRALPARGGGADVVGRVGGIRLLADD